MQDFINFLTNLRNNQREVGQKVNKAANDMTNYVVTSANDAWNQGVNAMTAPFKALGNEFGNAVNATGQSMGQAWNQYQNDVVKPVTNWMANTANDVNNFFGIGNNTQQQSQQSPTYAAPSQKTIDSVNRIIGAGNVMSDLVNSGITAAAATQAAPQAQAPAATGKTYQRDPAIDTFVSALRYFMNPIRGITGETPLDVLANQVSDSMYASFGKEVPAAKTESTKDTTETKSTATETAAKTTTPTETESDVVTYTYKPGDTFGQVLLDLGLNTGNGLWGSGGDVEYYTRQLVNQGALDRNGNIPIGTTIRLTRRK